MALSLVLRDFGEGPGNSSTSSYRLRLVLHFDRLRLVLHFALRSVALREPISVPPNHTSREPQSRDLLLLRILFDNLDESGDR
jgi:hypothetical protein